MLLEQANLQKSMQEALLQSRSDNERLRTDLTRQISQIGSTLQQSTPHRGTTIPTHPPLQRVNESWRQLEAVPVLSLLNEAAILAVLLQSDEEDLVVSRGELGVDELPDLLSA